MNALRPILLLLTPGFPASPDDADCLPMHALFVRTLAAQYPGVEVRVIAFQYPYHESPYIMSGAVVSPMDGRNRGGVHAWRLRRKVLRQLGQLQAGRRIVGILSFWYRDCAAVGERFARGAGLPHYCWILGQDARADNPWPARVPIPAGRLLALSAFLQAEFARNHGMRPAQVLPPGIDPAAFRSTTVPRDIDLMAAGSLIPLKRFERFVQLVAHVKKEFPQVRAVLAGAGAEETRLKTLALELRVEEHLTFTGTLPQPDVLLLMQRTRVFVHPSSYEGFSGVCMEALAAGAHVVSHCRAMAAGVLQWHIVPEDDGLAGEVLRLLHSPKPQVPVQPFLMTDTVKVLPAFFPGLSGCEDAADLPGDGAEGKLPLELPAHRPA